MSVVMATLEYDSARDRLCGSRGFGTYPRMLVFRWKGARVHLMVWDRNPGVCSVHGQVTERRARTPVAGAEVSGGGADVLTDRFGEFAVVIGEWQPRTLRVRTRGVEGVCSIPPEEELAPGNGDDKATRRGHQRRDR